MKTLKWMSGILAMALAVTFCTKEKEGGNSGEPQDETPAVLTSVKVLAADNEGIITEDIVVDEISETMIVRIPGGGVGKTITVTVTVGENDVVKINDEEISEDGKASFDATYPADIVVTNSKSGNKISFVLKVGKVLEIVGQPVALWHGEMERFWGGPLLTVSSKDDMPYIAYTRKIISRIYSETTGEGEEAVTKIKADMESNPRARAIKWNGSAFVEVGETPFSDHGQFANATTIIEAFDAAPNGDIYVLLRAEKNSSRLTVMKFDGSAWSYVGGNGPDPGPTDGSDKTTDNEHEINSTNVTSPAREIDFFFAGGKPGFVTKGNAKSVDKSEADLFEFDGSAWNKTIGLQGVPTYAETSNKAAFWGARSVSVGDVVYLLAQSNERGYYLLKKENGVWTKVVDNFIPEGATCGLNGSMEIAANAEGQVFIFVANWQGGVMQIYRLNSTNNTFEAYASALPTPITEKGAVQLEMRFGINPVSGQFIAVRAGSVKEEDGTVNADDKNLYFAMVDENRQWTEWVKIDSAPVSGDLSSMAFTSDGTAWVAYETGFTLDGFEAAGQLQLVRVGLEADILPE